MLRGRVSPLSTIVYKTKPPSSSQDVSPFLYSIPHQQQLGKMLRLLLVRSALVRLPAPALRRQGWNHPSLTPTVPPIPKTLNCGPIRSFTVTNTRMSTIEERVKKIVVEQLGVKEEEVMCNGYNEQPRMGVVQR